MGSMVIAPLAPLMANKVEAARNIMENKTQQPQISKIQNLPKGLSP